MVIGHVYPGIWNAIDTIFSFPSPTHLESLKMPQDRRKLDQSHLITAMTGYLAETWARRYAAILFFFLFLLKQFDQYHHNKARSPLAHRDFRTLVVDEMDVGGRKELPGHSLPSPFLSALQFAVVSSTRPPGHRSQWTYRVS
jgi:hypothetical protein